MLERNRCRASKRLCVRALNGARRRHARPSDSAIGDNRAGFFDRTHFSSDLLRRTISPRWAEIVFRRPPADFFERTHFCSILFLQSNGLTQLVFVIETDPLLLIPRGTGRDNRALPEQQVPFFAVDPLLLIPCLHVLTRSRHDRSNVPKR